LHGPDATFDLSKLIEIQGDYDSAFRSADFQAKCQTCYRIKVQLAAPRHQEQNGLHERNWQSVRELAFSFMNKAHVGMEFFAFAIEHAWKTFNVLPHKSLRGPGGAAQCTLGVYFNKPVSVSRFRTLFCPVVVTNGGTKYRQDEDDPRVTPTVISRQNESQQGYRGIHVGIPRASAGWLIYNPQTNHVNVSQRYSTLSNVIQQC
jgi:hypothetical protein